MRRKHLFLTLSGILCGLVFVFLTTRPTVAAVQNWQQGASMYPAGPETFGTLDTYESLRKLQLTGANYVAFVIPYYQADIKSTAIYPGPNTPTDAALIQGITWAHQLGLNVGLKFYLDPQDYQWRAYISPTDKASWFANYSAALNKYAVLAEAHGVEQIVIGAELVSMTSPDFDPANTGYWRAVIAQVRQRFSGTLTYSGQRPYGTWDEYSTIQFWDDLDYIGLSAYVPVSTDDNPTVDSIVATWSDYSDTYLKPVADQWGKPVILTEVGYHSQTTGLSEPWAYWNNGIYDGELQALGYEGLFTYWNTQDWMQGIYWWAWETDPNAGGEGNRGYTPQNKPAEAVMTEWFGGSGNPPQGTYAVEAAITPNPALSQQTATFTVSITSPINHPTVMVNFEIRNASTGAFQHQQFYMNQAFAAGTAKTFTFSWTPNMLSGNFVLKVGIMQNNWGELIYWNDQALLFAVTTTRPTPSPSPTPTATPTPVSSPSIQVTANPTPVAQQTTTLTGRVSTPQALTNVMVNFEVRDRQTNRLELQRFYMNQSFSSNETKQYQFAWTPSVAGTYVVKAGIMENNWGKLIYWDDSPAIFTVSSPTPATPTPTPSASPSPSPTPTPTNSPTPTPNPQGQLEIWWPTDGSAVSGQQTLKSRLANTDLASYSMHYSVDGRPEVLMENSLDVSPHKAKVANTWEWNWNADKRYVITFIARSLGGVEITRRQITVIR